MNISGVTKNQNGRFPGYGVAGVAIIVLAEAMLFLGVRVVGIYFTPLVWSGYILFIDALNVRARGTSLMQSRPLEFVVMLPWSVCCWLVYEGYNLHLHNWTYVGLPENSLLQAFGFIWSFATIFPAILETAELFEHVLPPGKGAPRSISAAMSSASVGFGMVCLVVPLVVRPEIAATLFALVWVGFYFLIDPLNFKFGGKSVVGEIQRGSFSRIYALVLSGIVCGVLWEFWNYWAIGKWKYLITFAGPKLFEMPVLGYLGFIPFAFECFAMQELLISIIPSLQRGAR